MTKFTKKEIWQHNGFIGTCVFARKGLQQVLKSRTASTFSKTLTRDVILALEGLEKSLKVKADAN